MTTRLDRLLLLLSTGSTPLVRQTAARQLGSIAGQRIARANSTSSSLASTSSTTLDATPSTYHGLDGEWGEVVNLLVKVLPFLKNRSWETRIAAALAVECIVKAVGEWQPPNDDNTADVSKQYPGAKSALVSFDLSAVLAGRSVLVASSGNEYSGTSNGQHGKNDIVKSLGLSMPGAGEAELGIDVEKELLDGESQQSRPAATDVNGKGKGRATLSTSSSPAPVVEEDSTKNLSARERNALKRKRKNAGSGTASPAPMPVPSKVRIVESPSIGSASTSNAPSPAAVPLVKKEEADDDEVDNKPGDTGLGMSETITVAYKGPKVGGGEVEAKPDLAESDNTWVPSPDQWPFTRIAETLQADLLHPAWEVRHGAALGLRELVKVQGRAGGMVAGVSAADNFASHKLWGDDLATALLTVFALDRFGDFLEISAVRETASQTLSALLLHVPDSSVFQVYSVLVQMIKQDTIQQQVPKEKGRKSHSWEVRHAGLLGTKYLVAVRKDLFQTQIARNGVKKEDPDIGPNSPAQLLRSVLQVAILGLRDSDDDVRGVAASALLPITAELVENLSQDDLAELLDVLCLCLGDLKDDLSSSIGNVMDLLAGLIHFPTVLAVLQDASKGRSLTDLVPRLFPLFRHTIPTVRLAVITTLNIFLSLPTSETKSWIDHRLLCLVYQNLVVEERVDICSATRTAWSTILRHLRDASLPHDTLQILTSPHLAGWLDILMTPVGQAVNTIYFWKPSEYDPNATGAYDVDKPILLQDLALVTVEQTLKGRLEATNALAELFSAWPLQQQEHDFGNLLGTYLTSASSHQIAFTCYLIEEWTRRLPTTTSMADFPLLQQLTPRIIAALEGDFPVSYSETSGLLSQIHTHCQQLFGIFKSKGKVPAGKIPNLDGTSGHGFTLARAQVAITTEYKALDALMKNQARSAAQPLLEELKLRIQGEIARMGVIKDSMDVQVFSALAGAAVALKTMPAKLNPLIRSLMNGVKFEINQDLQQRAARSVASFVDLCTLPNSVVKANPSDKVVKNLCTFLCQDTTITPLFAAHKSKLQGILDLAGPSPVSAANGKVKAGSGAKVSGMTVEVVEDQTVSKARLVRRGAEFGLASLSSQYGNALFERVPKLWICMSQTLLELMQQNNIDALDAQYGTDDAAGQDLLDCLTVLSAAAPYIPLHLQNNVRMLLPGVILAIQSKFAVVRYSATRCLAVLCNTITEEGMKRVIQDVIPLLGDPLSAAKRQGAVELVSCLVELLDIKILPYVIFLIVPILGRMTDSDDEVRKLATSTFATLVKLVPLEAGLPDPPGFSPELLQQRADEREFLTQLLDGSKVANYELPIAVAVDLRKYQREGINWLAFLAKYQLHGILCDDMGLGKTLQSICILASKTHERAERYAETQSPDAVHLPSLVVCPPTLTGHWQHEIETYVSNLKATIYGGDRSDRLGRIGKLKSFDVVITSYDVVRNDIEALSGIEWNYCILDEGHIIKNAKTKLSAAIKSIRANHRLILSGTPIQNNVLELWSLFDFLMPGFLGTEETFNRRFGKPIQQSRDAKSSSKDQEAGALALEALHKQVLPFLLRRLKEDVLDDLPPKIIQDYYCDLSPLQQDLYENYSKSGNEAESSGDAISSSNGGKDTHVFQTLQYLKKLVNHPTLVLQPDNPAHEKILSSHGVSEGMGELTQNLSQAPKLLALKQLLLDSGIGLPPSSVKKEIEIGEPAVAPHRVLIFCQMKTMLDLIETSLFRNHLPSITYMRMDGSTPSHKRHSVVQTFNADPSIDVLLLTTHVGGLGLNLTGADTVIFVEHDWNPMKDLQAMDRAHRLGQKRVVNVYRLITRGTLEEKIMGLQKFKMNIASTVVSQQNADMSTMETENVLDLFSLGNKEPEKQGNKNQNGPISQKALLEGLGELQDQEREYEDMDGDAGKFAESLKR